MLTNLIIAHRGIHNNKDIPENSILAFTKAIKKNLPIEFDVRITKDNKLVIFHDDNLKRMTNLDKKIEELTLNEIKQLNLLNTKEKIPTLNEVLNLVRGKVLLDIEIKNTKKKEEVITLLLDELSNYKGEVLLKSFNPLIIKRIKHKTNRYRLGLLLTNHTKNKLLNKVYTTQMLLKYIKPDFIAVDKRMFNRKYYKKVKDKYFIFLWTIKNEEELKKYQDIYFNLSYLCNNLY